MSTPGNTDVDVVVVGAGISGLATAFDLQRRGVTADVLDAATRAGGVIGTTHRDGALIESGPNSALDTTPLINELLDALGIRNERAEANAAPALATWRAAASCLRCRHRPARFLPRRLSRRVRSSASGVNRSFPPRHLTSRSRSPHSSDAGWGPNFSTTPSIRSSRESMPGIRSESPFPPRSRASTRSSRNTAASSKASSRVHANAGELPGRRPARPEASPSATACKR
jgi:monoamine oxidase